MKTLQATTARILLLCLIFIEQNVAEPARHNVVSHHQDTARRHHVPSGTQAPHKLAPASSKVYCISADSNIYEILHKANAYCRGNDFKCTFYHYHDHQYQNLGTIDVNRELFDKLLAKYENWLMTSEPIDENNGKDSNHKVRLKGSGNKLYSTYIIDEKTPDKANRNGYDANVMQDASKLDKHYRRHKAKLTGDQKTRYINGERVSVDPKFNKQQKYYEVFLPKDKHRGDPRTIYVDIDGDKENTDKELNNDLNDKPIKVKLNEYARNDEEKFAVQDKRNGQHNVYRHHGNNKIARTEDIEETNKYQSSPALDRKLGDHDKMLSDLHDTGDENTEDDDDKLHRIHLVETNKHHNDLSADNFTYKRTNTVQLNEPVFHVENPRNRNNMHIFSLPDYTGHHSDIISDYTGYKDIHLLPNLPDDEDVLSLPSNYDISLSEATEKESPITLYANPNLQPLNDNNLLPGRIKYYNPEVTHGTPFSSQSDSSPIVSSSSETAAIPKYSPFDIALRSSPYSGVPETLTPCDLKTLSQATISSSPSTVLSNEDKYKISLLSSPFEATKSFADSNLFKKLPSVTPETTYFSQPLDVTMPVDATTFFNNLPKSFESVASYPSTATMTSPINSKLGPEICQFPQMPYSSPYSQFSPPNLGLLNQLQQGNNFAKPMFNQNNVFSQPSRDIFDIKINPFITRPQFSYSYAEPFNPTPSYLSTPGSVINSSPSAYTNSILNGNRLPGHVSNSFLPLSPANQMSPLSLRQQIPNYYSPPCPKAVGTSPYNNISPLDLEKYQIADNLALNANVGVQDSLSPIQNIPSFLDHPYRTTPSNYVRPTQPNIFSSSAPSQAKPMILNALEKQLLESQGETSSYSELAHIIEKPCLNLQNEPLVTFDASLLGNHLLELSPTKPTISNTDVDISDGSIDSELNKLTPLDFSLEDSNSDTIHIQLNTTINLNQESQPNEDSNLILDSGLTEQDIVISPCTAVDNNKPSINFTTTINIESEQTLNNEAVISEFDSSLIGTGLPISSEDPIVTEFHTENLKEDSSLTDFIPLEQSDKNVERELNQTVNIKQESNQTGIEYSVTDEPITILPSDLKEKELKVDIGITGPQPLDSTLIDLESDNITETVAQEFETVDGLPNVNVTVCEPDINLSVQTNIDLKPEAENPQLLEKPTGSTIDITINTSVNITDNNLDVLQPELVETKPNEKSIITNKETEFSPLDETIHTKDKETVNEFEAGEFIPAFTSGMNIPTEDITAEILPSNELNSSLVGPSLDKLKEEPGIASTEVDITADLIGPTIFDMNETSDEVPSKVVELDSSLIKPISGNPTIPPCKEPLEVPGQSDIENLDSGAIKESDILLSSDPLTFENSLIGPSLINDTTRVETQPTEGFQEILPTSESPTINFESKLLGPSLLPHKDPLNIESSLVGPGLDQVINAPEEINSSDANLNFSSNLIGPNLIIDANEPDLLRKLEAGTKVYDDKPGPKIVDGKPLVEESVPYSEYQLDGSLIGPDLSIKIEPKPHLNIIAKTNEVKPGLDQTNSVILDSSLVDNLLDTEKNINGPNGPSIVSSANILSSDLKREGLPLEADISLICPNPAFEPKYEELPSSPTFVPKISFSHDLIGPGLSKLHPETSLPNPYITQEGTPIVSNGFLEELKPTTYSKLPDLYLPATPFKNAPQHSLPCEHLFTSSPLTSSLLNNRLPASVLNLPSNILSDHQSPLYANTIPSSLLSPSSKYLPLHNLPHTPFSSPYLKPEYLQSIKNPLVLNALLNNPHLKDAISYYSPIQPPEPYEQIGLPRLPNLQNLPNQYLQALNGIPFNFQQLKSTIPCASQTQNPLSIPEMNWQELENLPVGVQNTPVKPAFKPVKNQAIIPSSYSPLQIKESDSLFDLNHQNYHMIESELNKFIEEAKNDKKLKTLLNEDSYETLEEPPCEKVKYLPEDNVEKYISEATAFAEPLDVAKEQLNLKKTEFIKLEPELHYPMDDAIDLPRNLSPKYKPKVEEQVCYQPLNEAGKPPPKYKPKVKEQVFYDPLKEADILKDYQLFEAPFNTPIVKPSVAQKIPKLPSTEQFYSHPYEMLPEPLALPVKPSSSPASYAKAQTSPLLSPPCLQEYTSVPASEYLPSSNLRPMPTPLPSRPSKTYASSYLSEYSSPSYIDTYNIPIEAPKPAMPYKPCETYASPYLPTHSNAPLFETGIPMESPNLPISALSKELPILSAPLKPLSSAPLTPAEFMGPSYYSPSSTTYTDSPFINQANILTEPLSSLSATSGLPCLRPLPETNPIFRKLMANPQFMKAMNLPIANNIFPWNNANRKPNPFMLQTPNYLPYESIPINLENLKKNQLYSTAIESNLQKLKDEKTELWTTHDETNSYAYNNDSGTKINENIVPENHLETAPYTLDSKEYTNVAVNKDLTSSPVETPSHVIEFSKLNPAIQSFPIKLDSSKKNELSAPISELNSQKLETDPSEVFTAYDEKSNYIYTNDSGTKIHEPERHLETVPYTLESEKNLKVNEIPINNYATESILKHGRPVSYSQVKEAEYYKPILETPQASDMQWLPLSSIDYSPNSPPGPSKPCPKLSPFIQSPYLQALPHFPSFLPSMKGSPFKSKIDSLPYSSSPYYPAIVEEYSELPTAPFRDYTPLLPIKSNVLENFVPLEAAPYSPSGFSSPYSRLPSPASYLPSYQSNMSPLPGLQLTPATAEQLRYVPPIAEGPSPIEYTPVESPINTLPSKSMTPIPCPSPTSTLPIQNLPLLQEPPISYESYEQPGPSYATKYQNIIEHLPTPVPLKESSVYYEPASSPRLIKSPNIIESLPFTLSPSSEDIRRPVSDKLSPINYASYTSSPSEEYIEVSPSLPCRPFIKPISPLPKPQPQLSVDEYTILPSSSEATPFETYSSYKTESYVPDVTKPCPKPKPDLAKYLPVDTSPYQIIDEPYTPVNKAQTPSNFEYISESSPLLKQLLTPPFKGYNSLPFATNVKLPYLSPTYMPLDMINTLPPALMNPFTKSELREILAPLSVQTNEITSTPKESNTVSDISSLDNYEEYIEPCPLPKPLQSSSLIKPLMTPIEASPELFKEIPIEFENVISSSANIPQYISPTNSLQKQLIGNAYNSPQNNKQKAVPTEIESTKLSTHEPIICNIDETSSPITPIVSELPDVKPCDLKASLFDQYQTLPIEKISPITMTPLSTAKSPLLTSPYQEISPIEITETLPISNVRPTSSSGLNPPHRPSKLNPIPLQYGPKSIVEYLPGTNNICPSDIPSYMEPAMVEATPYAPKSKNIKQINLDGFPIAELFAKAPKILPYNPLSKIEIPKTSEYQNLPKDSSDWVLINNDNLAEEKDAKLTPCEYTQTTENPAEAEYLKLAKLLESKTPKTEFEKYSELIEENQYKEIPSNVQDDNVCKNVYKPENIGINLPEKPQNLATFDNFYANNHIGASPLICLIDPRRESKPIKPLIDARLSYNEKNPDIITYLDENLSGNIDLATESDYNFITPSENLRSVPVTPIESSPIYLDPKYLDKPTFKSPKMIYGPNPVEYLPENQYYYPPKDNIDDLKYSGYKTYQLPTQKLAEKSSNIASETYYPAVPLSTPKSSIPNSYMPTISPETYRPEYESLESHIQPKSDLKVQPQSPIYNNYYPTNEVTAKPDNLDKNDEIKNCIINYINSKGLKDKLYTNNEEITIPIGDIAITKKEPHTAKILPTSNPSIGLKVWQSNVKLVKAELKFKTNEVSVNNFMPILNNLNEYDIQEIRKIIKKYIDDKYGNHIEVNEPYTIDNQYTVIKDLNRNVDKYNLLWPTYYV